jgi:hypothetical protein
VDQSTSAPATARPLTQDTVHLPPSAVTVVTLSH